MTSLQEPVTMRSADGVDESFLQYRHILESSLDGILITGPDGRVLIANPAALGMLELGDDAAPLAIRIFDYIAPESMDLVVRDFAGMREGRKGIVRTYRAVTARGNDLFVEVLGHQIACDGQPVNIFSVRNVTRRKQAEAALRSGEQKYRLLAENSLDIINHHDGDLNLTYLSPAVRTILGYDPAWITGRNVLEFIWPEDTAFIRAVHQRLVSGETCTETIVYRLLHCEGHPVWVESTVHAIANPLTGKVSEFYNVTRDITARKQAEEAARRRERMLHGFAAAQGFLLTGRLEDPLPRVLATIGEAMDVDVSYIFMDPLCLPGTDPIAERKYRWSKRPRDGEGSTRSPHAVCGEGFPTEWTDRLRSGAWIAGPRSRFSGSEREMLDGLGIRSILIVPLFVREASWGFIGLSEMSRERVWEDTEIEILMTLAATIGIVLEKLWFSRFWMQQIGLANGENCGKCGLSAGEKKIRTG